tara:strand:+ start:175 stop:1896 length:1722 start_codon:yes stop_codon:yes gene_type:complete
MFVALMLSAGASFALPACPSDQTKRYHNCFGTYTFASGEKYVGEYKDGKMDGQGTLTFASGDEYVGEYKDGEKNGQGTYTWANGEKYVGEWKDDKTNGQGVRTYANGDKYVGENKDGKKNGQGTYTFPNGEKYVGEYKDGKMDGQGTYTWANGNKYVGEYKDNKRHGQGTLTWPDGDKYVGEYKDDEMAGFGVYFHFGSDKFSGDRFFGIFKNNLESSGLYIKRNGRAKFIKNWRLCDNCITDNAHNVLPVLKRAFNLLDKENRQAIQKNLKKIGMYHSTVDGLWGRGTLNAIAEFSVLRMKTIEFNSSEISERIINTILAGDFSPTLKIEPAPVPVIKAPIQSDAIISASSGSGFSVSADGYVITNNHVIEGCQKVVVHTKSKDVTMRLITYDPQNDLALLKGDFRPSTVFALSRSRPELLQDVYVAGYPFGVEISTAVKVTKGIISSLTGIGNNFSNIQIDAALQSGNSGGPIIDELGNVVGVAVSKLDAKYMFDNFGSIPENTNFGIKSNVVRNILDSNDVDTPSANQSEISKSKLGKMISNGTYYISCWMTMAQVEKLRTKKVMFEALE